MPEPRRSSQFSTVVAPRAAAESTRALDWVAYLVVFEGDSTRMVPLPSVGEFVIGRADTSDLVLNDQRISRSHARLSLSQGRAQLHDLGSQNGTLVNGATFQSPYLLMANDVITVGAVTLIFHSSMSPAANVDWLDVADFRARVEGEVERARRLGKSLAMVELNFERVPFTQALESALASDVRKGDLVCLLNPSQLCVVLPDTEDDEARMMAETLLQHALTVSQEVRVGVAQCPNDGSDVATLSGAAHSAALAAPPRQIATASSTAREFDVGGYSVLVADETMMRLYELVNRLADSPLPVLVTGETGCGKELVAGALHHRSSRARERFFALNCAAVPESLLESELFGHEKGAFTGAVATKVGLFEQANGGTLFLDEVGEMPATVQAKLLRVLETRSIIRVGDTRPRNIDIRLVAATHRDLTEDVKSGRFRQDLYFRLAGATLWIPPLRDRPRELPLLARRFLSRACELAEKPVPELTAAALARLSAYRWPGNARELKNVMEYFAVTCEGIIDGWQVTSRLEGQLQLPPKPAEVAAAPGPFRPLAEELRELEERRMLEALKANDWNQTRAAQAISMPLRTFVTRFKQLDLAKKRGDGADASN